jgi:intracellular multiplication protein IcmT
MWRNTGQPVRVLMLDARACLPVVLAAVYWSWTTLYTPSSASSSSR